MLKYLAMLAMFLDHIGVYFYPLLPPSLYMGLRLVGRLAMPIFVYYLVLGLGRSRSIFRYLLRLFVWACVTELGLRLLQWQGLMGQEPPNVLFNLAATLLFLIAVEFLRHAWPDVLGGMRRVAAFGPGPDLPRDYQLRLSLYGLTLPRRFAVLFALLALLLSLALIGWLRPDYGYMLLGLALCYYLADEERDKELTGKSLGWPELRPYALMFLLSFLLFFLDYLRLRNLGTGPSALIQIFGAFAVWLFPLAQLSGKRRPGNWERLACYAFYPLHKVLLILLAALIMGPVLR